jgi:hypothetical protein
LLVDLVEARGALASCAAYVEQNREAVEQLLGPDALGRVRDAGERGPPGGRKDPPEPKRADVAAALLKRCASLPARIAKAVRFAAPCSPYLPGKRELPDFVALIRLHQAAAALAAIQADSRPARAARLLLRLLRLNQDLERGPTPWIWPYVLRAGWRPAVAVLARILAASGLNAAQRRTVDEALQRLLTSEPPLPVHLRGEHLMVQRRTFMKPLAEGPDRGTPGQLARGGQGHLLAWLAFRQRAHRREQACPVSLAARRCHRRLQALEANARVSASALRERWAAFQQWLTEQRLERPDGRFDRGRARRAALALLSGAARSRHAPHLLRAAQRSFFLNAMRLHLSVRQAQQKRSTPLGATAVSELAARLPDPFGRTAPAVEGNPGALTVRPPRRLSPAGEPPVRYLIRWPTPRPSPSSRPAPDGSRPPPRSPSPSPSPSAGSGDPR